MKKIGIYSMAILMLGIGTLGTGCMGSWKLTKSIYDWNDGASGNKFVDNIIFWVLLFIPVYQISMFVDYVILNTIEFWTGSNPMAMAPGEKEAGIVKGKDGNDYEITVTQYRYDIVALTGKNKGEKTSLYYTPVTKSWNTEKDGIVTVIATIHDDLNKVEVFGKDGSVKMLDMGTMASGAMLNAGF